MTKDLFKLSIAAIMALSFVGCDDDSSSDDNGDACTENAIRCADDGSSTQICKNGEWGLDQACSNGCENNACKTNTSDKCDAGAKKCADDGSKVLVCENNAWKDGDACSNGCSDGVCKTNTSDKCDDGAKKCADDGSKVLVCENNAWKDGDACSNGCSDGVCKTNTSDKCDDGATKCSDDGKSLMVCQDNKWDVKESCTNGCENNACVPGASVGDYCAKGGELKCSDNGNSLMICKNGSWSEKRACASGCDSDSLACKAAAECDPKTYVEKCDGTRILTCGNKGKVEVALDCAEYYGSDTTCGQIKDSHAIGCYDIETGFCNKGDANVKECWGGYLGEWKCVEAEDNKYIWDVVDSESEVACDSYLCTDDHTACAEIEGLDEECTSDEYPMQCNGSIITYCSYGYVWAESCQDYEYDTCGSIGGVVDCYDKCEADSAPKSFCEYSDSYEGYVVGTSSCVAGDDGNHYVKKSANQLCYDGCNATKDGCKFADSGMDCTVDSYPDKCADEVTRAYCYARNDEADGFVVNEECDVENGETCQVIDGTAKCIRSCSKEGDKTQRCAEDGYGAYVSKDVCTDVDGTLMWEMASYETCSMECDEDSAACIEPAEGDTCDVYSFTETCKDNATMVYCDGTVVFESCEAGQVCGIEFGYFGATAACYDTCDKEGDKRQVCEDSYAFYQVCSSEPGSLIWVEDDVKYEYCANGCNEEKGVCNATAPVTGPVSEGDECGYSFDATCINDTTMAYCGSDYKIVFDTCDGNSICVVEEYSGWTNPMCMERCNNEGDQMAVCVDKYGPDDIYVSRQICKNFDGKLAWYEDSQVACASSCEDGVCDK